MRDDARQQGCAPDEPDDHTDQQFSNVAIEQAAREQIGGVAEHHPAGADRVHVGRRHQPGPDPTDDDHDHGHERQAARSVHRDERAHEQERDRVVDEVRRKVRVQEPRGADRPQVADVAGVDPSPAVQSLAVERVDPLDQPHEGGDHEQQTEPLDRLSPLLGDIAEHRCVQHATRRRRARPFLRTVIDQTVTTVGYADPPPSTSSWPIASATSARHPSAWRSANSPGVWAPPPRGPSPSIVSGIEAAKWLASEAPPRGTPTIGLPRAPRRTLQHRCGRRDRIHPGPLPAHPRVQLDLVELRRNTREHRRERLQPLGAHVADQLAGGGHDIERGSGAHHGRHDRQLLGARHVVKRRDPGRQFGPAPTARCGPGRGRRPNAAARPVASTRSVPAALRLTTTPSRPSAVR